MSKRLILLDSHAILHRAYHALPDFATSKGEATGALYGLCTMILSAVEKLKPDYIVAAYDLPKPTHRHEAYKDYKAGRAKTDDALVQQIIRSRDIFAALGIPVYDKEGFEADDILGTIVEKTRPQWEKKGDLEVIIASGDMDTLQLVSGEKVRVYTLKKGIKDTIIYDEESVRERFGFGPELLPDYKGLRGDPSDNIIGIKGIGEKTATALITAFGGIEGMYKALKKDKGSFAKKAGLTPRLVQIIEEGQEDAEFSKVLATIRRDAPIDWALPAQTWREAIDVERATKLFAELEFRAMATRLKHVLGRDVLAEAERNDSAEASAARRREDEGLVHQDQSPYSAESFREAAVMLWLVKSDMTDPSPQDIMEFTGAKTFDEAYQTLAAEVKKRGLSRVWEEIEKPLMPIVDKMKGDGVKIDVAYLEKLGAEYHKELATIEKSIHRMAGVEFNIASPKQLGEVLFVKLGLKPSSGRQKKTAGGALSTKESELEKLADEHPIIDEILKYRELAKLLGTYIDTIPTYVDENDRIHPTSIQAGAATGRMATKDPAIQNIPNRTDLGRRIRNAFIAEKGWKLVAFDYSQIELRIAAFLSQDETFVDIFRRGEDVHAAVAAQVFGVPVDSVTKAMRSQAKVINFGVMYGMGVTALQKNMGVDRKAAQKFYNDYFERFHGLAGYLAAVKAEAARKGYTETYFGRRRYFEGLRSRLPFIRAAAERMAINAPIQGTEADIVKLAMVRIDEYIRAKKLGDQARILMQVHDEIVIEAKDAVVRKIVPDIKEIMEGIIPPKDIQGITIVAEAKAGENWGEMEKV
ncbi:MAG TPA: DNA polymerase [Candidatus Paceibacterota bacterium]|nr:DNA polymerase [Candidatus Paceibacterota bacterium]